MAGAVPTVLLAAAPAPPVAVALPVAGVASVEGGTDVPAEESASPAADTPGPAAPGPTLMVVAGAAGEDSAPVEAGAVPVGGRGSERDVAGAVPDGVGISDVAVVGAALAVSVPLALAVVPALVAPLPDVPM